MRIEQLEYVAAVTRHGSLRRASERLHISQPALSEAVSKLERELGVSLLDRRRSGARISREGRELLEHMADVTEAVERLRRAAGDQKVSSRLIRLGTVGAASATLLAPALRSLRDKHPTTAVEVLELEQADIHAGLLEGALDLGLVNLLSGEDVASKLHDIELLRGRPVVVLPHGHPLSERSEIGVEELRAEPFVEMRTGYAMHRFTRRMFGDRPPNRRHTTDGAEMGKLMVAEGLGVTVLPHYSVAGDPLERAGLVIWRPIAGSVISVRLVLQQRATAHVAEQVQVLRTALIELSRTGRAGTSRSAAR